MKHFGFWIGMLFSCSAFSQIPFYNNNYAVWEEPNVLVGTANNYCNRPVEIRVNIYKPIADNNSKRPVVILVPGGASVSTADQNQPQMNELAQAFAKRGYVAITADYREGLHLFPYGTGLPEVLNGGLINPFADYASLYATDKEEVYRAVYRARQDLSSIIKFIKARNLQDSSSTCKFFIAGHSAGAITCLATAFMDQPSERPSSSYALSAAPNPNWTNRCIWELFGTCLLWQPNGPERKDDAAYATQNPAPFNYDAPNCYQRPDLGPMEGTLYTNSNYDDKVLGVGAMCGAVDSLGYINNQSHYPAVWMYQQPSDIIVPYGTGKPFDFLSSFYSPSPNFNWPVLNGSGVIENYLTANNYPAPHRLWAYTGNNNTLLSHDLLPSTTVLADSMARFFGQVMDTATACFPDGGPLPIGLNFYASKLNGVAQLNWLTNSLDVLTFEVERSLDGIHFSTISSVNFETGRSAYSITDPNYLKHGVTYYRIKEKLFNATFSYSRVQKIISAENLITHIYPIPAKDFIKVNLQLPPNASGVEVGLYDAVGKKLWVIAVGQNASEISIPVNTVSGGLYLLKISLPGGQPEIHKIIVQKN